MKKNSFFTKIELLNFKITLLLAKLDIVGSRPVSNYLIFSGDIRVDIQSLTFSLLSILGKLSNGTKI